MEFSSLYAMPYRIPYVIGVLTATVFWGVVFWQKRRSSRDTEMVFLFFVTVPMLLYIFLTFRDDSTDNAAAAIASSFANGVVLPSLVVMVLGFVASAGALLVAIFRFLFTESEADA